MLDVQHFEDRLARLRASLLSFETSRSICLAELSALEVKKDKKEQDLLLLEKALIVIDKLVVLKKEEPIRKIESIVTYGIQTVFNDPSLKFVIESKVLRNQQALYFRVYSAELGETTSNLKIHQYRGGGLVNVVSFIMRAVLLVLIDRDANRTLFLDEPFGNLSEKYHEQLLLVLKDICTRLKYQITLVTHEKALEQMGDSVYNIVKQAGFPVVRKVR